MNTTQVVTVGALLHDIGNAGFIDIRKYIKDQVILDCILDISNKGDYATLSSDSPSYIVRFADIVSSGTSGKTGKADAENRGYKAWPLYSIFNLLNNGSGKAMQVPSEVSDSVKFPVNELKTDVNAANRNIANGLSARLSGMKLDEEHINSLLDLLEHYLSYIPSLSDSEYDSDISLYDHLKITAALSACLSLYLEHNSISDYRTELYTRENEFRNVRALSVCALDVSGIQHFIYSISSKGALKALRSRSFYLEILLENTVDEILSSCGLSRANVIYTGGGHAYLLLPNTEKAASSVEQAIRNINRQLMDKFGTNLFIAYGIEPCSANEIMSCSDDPESYTNIFRNLSARISEMKLRRYTPDDIRRLNAADKEKGERECAVCGVSEKLTDTENGTICETCAMFTKISGELIKPDNIIVITAQQTNENFLPLYAGNGQMLFLQAMSVDDARNMLNDNRSSVVRIYSKNKLLTGLPFATRLWMGDYYSKDDEGNIKTFEELGMESGGIERIAVLRADVDNLGMAFVKGFIREWDPENKYRFVSISRTSSFSRNLSVFFKHYINDIMKNPVYKLKKKQGARDAVIVYSGGDDMFIVGAWDEVLSAAIDINSAFKRYTGGALTISAGLSIFDYKYPVSRMAEETAELEGLAKKYVHDGKEKDSVALFGLEYDGEKFVNHHTYDWKTFEEKVLGEKFAAVKEFLRSDNDHGSSFLYGILELLRRAGSDRLNIARLAFLLARREPLPSAPAIQMEAYRRFAESIYKWALENEDRRQLITAIMIYIYSIRSKKEENANAR